MGEATAKPAEGQVASTAARNELLPAATNAGKAEAKPAVAGTAVGGGAAQPQQPQPQQPQPEAAAAAGTGKETAVEGGEATAPGDPAAAAGAPANGGEGGGDEEQEEEMDAFDEDEMGSGNEAAVVEEPQAPPAQEHSELTKDELADLTSGASLVQGLRDVQQKLQDTREALNMYRIIKAEGSRQLDDLMRMRRKEPGGPTWAAALSLQQKVDARRDVPNQEFDTLVDEMHKSQMAMYHELKLYSEFRKQSSKLAREMVHDAAQEESSAAKLLEGDGSVRVDTMVPLVRLPPGRPRCGRRAREALGGPAPARRHCRTAAHQGFLPPAAPLRSDIAVVAA